MTTHIPAASVRGLVVTAAISLAILLAGCGGGMEFGPAARVPQDQRQAIAASAVGTTVRLPGDRAFNIHLKQSTQNPGADGSARGEADAQPNGTAMCRAEATNGGASTGEFTLGQAIDMEAEKPLRAHVTLRYRMAQELTADPFGSESLGSANLTAFVRDSTGVIHPKLSLQAVTTDDAPGRTSRDDVQEFDVDLEPGRSYQIVLRGGVNAKAAAVAKVVASLHVTDVSLEMTLAEAPVAATAPAK